jgi:hypothetical protein
VCVYLCLSGEIPKISPERLLLCKFKLNQREKWFFLFFFCLPGEFIRNSPGRLLRLYVGTKLKGKVILPIFLLMTWRTHQELSREVSSFACRH